MKKFFLLIISIALVQCNTYSMIKSDKKSFFGKIFGGTTLQNELEVPVDRIQLMNEQQEILPNLYIVALSHLLDKNPKEFLDLQIQLPSGSVREYLAYQEFRDRYFHASKEEHHEHINEYLSRVLFDDDDNAARAVTNLYERKLTTLHFRSIRDFLEAMLREKKRNEKMRFKQVCWQMLPTCVLSLNVGIVAGLGLYLLKKEENKPLFYTLLSVGLSGALCLIPQFYQHGVSMRCSMNNFHEYDTYSRTLDQDCQDDNVIKTTYYISN